MAYFNLLFILKTALQTPEFINKLNIRFNTNLKPMEKREVVWESIKNYLEASNPIPAPNWREVSIYKAHQILDSLITRNTIADKVKKGFIRTSPDGQVYEEDMYQIKLLLSMARTDVGKSVIKRTTIDGKEVLAIIPKSVNTLKSSEATQETLAFAYAVSNPKIQEWAKNLVNDPYVKKHLIKKTELQ